MVRTSLQESSHGTPHPPAETGKEEANSPERALGNGTGEKRRVPGRRAEEQEKADGSGGRRTEQHRHEQRRGLPHGSK